MKNLFSKTVLILLLGSLIFQTNVYANSSWQWLTSSPKEILPLAITITLFIEIIGISLLGGLGNKLSVAIKGALIIIGANIASFSLPYVFRALSFHSFSGSWSHAWYDAFSSGPYYIVLLGYLFLTVAIEVPVIYYYLVNYTKNKRVLLTVIISVNVLTTLIVAVMERIMFHGQW